MNSSSSVCVLISCHCHVFQKSIVQQLDPILLRAEHSQQDDEENSDSYFSD